MSAVLELMSVSEQDLVVWYAEVRPLLPTVYTDDCRVQLSSQPMPLRTLCSLLAAVGLFTQ